MLKLEIHTGGAAFCNDYTGEPDNEAEEMQCAWLLKRVSDKLKEGRRDGVIMDTNGNRVGEWKLD